MKSFLNYLNGIVEDILIRRIPAALVGFGFVVWILSGCSSSQLPTAATIVQSPTAPIAVRISQTPTPRSIPQSPPAPTAQPQITSTKTPGEHDFGPTEKIFIWNPLGSTSEYGFFDLNKEHQVLVNRLTPTQKDTVGPSRSIALSFSRYSGQVAYFVKGEKLELWIADQNLLNGERAWVDEKRWLGDVDGFEDMHILWGVKGRYLIISSDLMEAHLLVYDLNSKTAEQLLGQCNQAARSTTQDNLSIWCSDQTSTGKIYSVLESNGIHKVLSQPQRMIARPIDWVFSKDGKRLLLATSQRRIVIGEANGSLLDLPVTYPSDFWLDIVNKKNLQWTQDGRYILVYGYDTSASLCPKQVYLGLSDRQEQRPCWLLLDSTTGKVVWWPKESISTKVGVPWRYLGMAYDATLSPDGKWLATTLTDTRAGHLFFFIKVSIPDGREVVEIASEQGFFVNWEDTSTRVKPDATN